MHMLLPFSVVQLNYILIWFDIYGSSLIIQVLNLFN
jgi:hypothetical protein